MAGEGGAVHEVPGILPAPALLKQESEGGVALTTGAGVGLHYIGKREAEADAGLVLGGYGYGLPYYGYGLNYAYHAAPALVATGGAVPVAVGGYKAVGGEGGAVHEVPALFGAPALAKQEAEGGVSLTTGTGGVLVYGELNFINKLWDLVGLVAYWVS